MYYNVKRKGKERKGEDMMNSNICPVDVIALYSANGDIRPLRFRVEDETHQLMRIDIDKIVNSREIQYAGIEARVFLCYATVRGKKWLFELKYTIRSHSWCLLRKVY